MKRPVALRASGAASVGVEVISTGVLGLDLALGIGGWPCGRVVEVFGAAAAGKTTLALEGLIQAQKLGFECCYVDVEQSVDFTLAQAMGVDLDALAIAQPTSGDEAMEVALEACKAGARFVVVDSVAALVPRDEISSTDSKGKTKGGMLKQSMGAQARLMSQSMRSLIGAAKRANAVLLFINQTRSKVGVIYGDPTTTPGGVALPFYASARVKIRESGKVEAKGKNQIGIQVTGKVVKNKLAPPMTSALWEIVWGKGIDRGSDIVRAGLALGVLKKSGAWISLDGERIGGSLAIACEALRENDELAKVIEDACRAKQASAARDDVEYDDPEVDPESVDLTEEDEDADGD
jgi:recombination protein RecA